MRVSFVFGGNFLVDRKLKEGEHVHEVVLPTVSFCEHWFAIDKDWITSYFCDDRIVCVAGRAWAIRVESSGIL